MTDVSNMADILDSRDIIARIEELRDERDSWDEDISTPEATWAESCPDDDEELQALEALAQQCEGYGDWERGEALIRESYFETYAQELAEDLYGEAIRNSSWPFNCIDWEQAADALRYDYRSVDFDGVTYLMHA